MANQKKGRKVGRNKRKGHALAYRNESRQEKSHVRRITKHLKRYGEGDKVAVEALKLYKIKAGIISAKPEKRA